MPRAHRTAYTERFPSGGRRLYVRRWSVRGCEALSLPRPRPRPSISYRPHPAGSQVWPRTTQRHVGRVGDRRRRQAHQPGSAMTIRSSDHQEMKMSNQTTLRAFAAAAMLTSACDLSEEAPRNESITAEELSTDLHYLAGDDMRGRLVGTPDIERAADFIASRFDSLGLEPAGADGSFFEPFDLAWFSLAKEKHAHRQRRWIQRTLPWDRRGVLSAQLQRDGERGGRADVRGLRHRGAGLTPTTTMPAGTSRGRSLWFWSGSREWMIPRAPSTES